MKVEQLDPDDFKPGFEVATGDLADAGVCRSGMVEPARDVLDLEHAFRPLGLATGVGADVPADFERRVDMERVANVAHDLALPPGLARDDAELIARQANTFRRNSPDRTSGAIPSPRVDPDDRSGPRRVPNPARALFDSGPSSGWSKRNSRVCHRMMAGSGGLACEPCIRRAKGCPVPHDGKVVSARLEHGHVVRHLQNHNLHVNGK